MKLVALSVGLATMVCVQTVAAQCDPTLPRAHFITCLSNQHQQQTGILPHQSYFQAPMIQAPQSVYQQPAPAFSAPAPVYQAPAPTYQQPPTFYIPPSRQSSYR